MSTAIETGSFLNRRDPSTTDDARDARAQHELAGVLEHGLNVRFATYLPADEPKVEQGVRVLRYTPTTRATGKQAERKDHPRVIRRMNGFLVEMTGAEARVAFVDNDETILYDLPADQLRRSGIVMKNQPFQMDEVELKTAQGLFVGYHFQPLAKPSDAYIEMLDFDEERKRKRDLILKEFSKPKG